MALHKKHNKDIPPSLEEEVKRLSRAVEVEAALEKVRNRATAMRTSAELAETSAVLFHSVKELGIDALRASVGIFDDANDAIELWLTTGSEGEEVIRVLDYVNLHIHPVFESLLAARKKLKPYSLSVLKGQEVKNYYKITSTYLSLPSQTSYHDVECYYSFLFAQGSINVIVTQELSEEECRIMGRFANTFGLIYTRFLDLQKAEAQTREAQIELALERVRARTMAMQNSNELAELVSTLFHELIQLGFSLTSCNIWIHHSETQENDLWVASSATQLPRLIRVTPFYRPFFQSIIQAWKVNDPRWSFVLEEKDKRDFQKAFYKAVPDLPAEMKSMLESLDRLVFSASFNRLGAIEIVEQDILSDEKFDILHRFGKVFELGYTRFNDLKKAEAQAREAQIEVAVERVRAKALAMHKSEDLHSTVVTLKKELMGLRIKGVAAATIYLEQDDGSIRILDLSGVDEDGKPELRVDKTFRLEATDPKLWVNSMWKGTENYFVVEADEADFERTIKFLYTIDPAGAKTAEKIIHEEGIKRAWLPTVKLEKGRMNIDLLEPPTAEIESILLKMGAGFDLAYTRFLDLQKAEAQAREAQIEAALERVRAQTMAMHNSEDVGKCIVKMFSELTALGVHEGTRFGIGILNHDNQNNQVLTARKDGEEVKLHIGNLDMTLHPLLKSVRNAWKEQASLHQYVLEGNDLVSYYQMLSKVPDYRIPISIEKLPDKEFHYGFIFSQGFFYAFSPREFHLDLIHITQRFTKVFEQTYTRFLDLQKAEAQAREAQIESVLEKVRAASMAMHKSEELQGAINVIISGLNDLAFDVHTAQILIYKDNPKGIDFWTASSSTVNYQGAFWVPGSDIPYTKALHVARENRQNLVSLSYAGAQKDEVFTYLFTETDYRNIPEERKKFIMESPAAEITVAIEGDIGVQVIRYLPRPLSQEEISILHRLSKVFKQTYTRFLDLQKAEAQAREAQIEASLERVRSSMMAMHQSDGLPEVMKVISEQLVHLGVRIDSVTFTPLQMGKDLRFWAATSEQPYPILIHVPYIDHPTFNVLAKAIDGDDLVSYVLSKEEARRWWEHFFDASNLGQLVPESRKSYVLNSKGYSASMAIRKNSTLGIANYSDFSLSDEENSILKRFANVFEQAYTRFLDIQKAEAQAREAQIELALERIRARSMAMQKSEEVRDVIEVMFQQFQELSFKIDAAYINLDYKESDDLHAWIASTARTYPTRIDVPYLDNEFFNILKEGKDKGLDVVTSSMAFEEKNRWWEHFLKHATISPERRAQLLSAPGLSSSNVFLDNVTLCIANYQGVPFSDAENAVLKRFGTVFEQSYTRFLDLQKAETQAREAEIQLALERVRARAMAMHHSDELKEVAGVMREQFSLLGQPQLETVAIHLYPEDGDTFTSWFAIRPPDHTGKVETFTTRFSKSSTQLAREMLSLYESGTGEYTVRATGAAMQEWMEMILAALPDLKKLWGDQPPGEQYWYFSDFSAGSFLLIPREEPSKESKDLLKRSAAVFDLAYRRYADLKKAEAQAREAQIEAALERVRSRSLAMHKSTEIQEVVAVVFTQLRQLGLDFEVVCIATRVENTNDLNYWVGNEQNSYESRIYFPYTDFSVGRDIIEAMDNGAPFFSKAYPFEEKNRFWKHAFEHSDFRNIPEARQEYILNSPRFALSIAPVNKILFQLVDYSGKVTTEQEAEVVKRFARVFEQCYVRFQDLEKAEAQAHEATIQASLERVRAKAMAMHNSNDLISTASLVFTELKKLGIHSLRSGVGLLNKENRLAKLYSATTGEEDSSLSLVGSAPLEGHPVLGEIYDRWLRQEDYFPVLKGDLLKTYYEKLQPTFNVPSAQANVYEQEQHGYFLPFSEGQFYGWSDKPYTVDEIGILSRFKAILDLTFRRYIELQKAEANALEAVRSASLDRVRAEIASMRTVQDLDRITPLIWRELTTLGIPFVRCGVFIMNEEKQHAQVFLSTPDGKAIASFHMPYKEILFTAAVEDWRQKRVYTAHWGESEFSRLADILFAQGDISNREQYLNTVPKEGIYLYYLPFLQGALYVGHTSTISEEDLHLVQSVADAFSTAYARYEDFNRLEAAKKTVENTLTDLRQAQQQLVQSEKMASLGELTAGIAHEIQNPLNFVNNFSEVSKELLDEMEEELKKGNTADANQIARNVIENLEKIAFHGKRADGIVKSMLQHSRKSTGQKELTDINALCDEYLRLSYHGLRAKDKSFNAKFETDLDPAVGKLNVLPQEIGRVILNLINNAFYAVTEKKKLNLDKYEPNVTVTTRKTEKHIEVRVKDNGIGISQKVLDKIFNPFFTTKPTGQGTGLGLSLSYDIITKGHGGELKVVTKEGEGSEFIVQLPIT